MTFLTINNCITTGKNLLDMVLGARHFLCHRSYEGTVSFLKESNCNQLSSVCLKNDCICVANGSTLKAESHQSKF